MYFLIKDYGNNDLVGVKIRNLRQLNKHIESCDKENIIYYVLKEATLSDVSIELEMEGMT
jgi:hypothetical protein